MFFYNLLHLAMTIIRLNHPKYCTFNSSYIFQRFLCKAIVIVILVLRVKVCWFLRVLLLTQYFVVKVTFVSLLFKWSGAAWHCARSIKGQGQLKFKVSGC